MSNFLITNLLVFIPLVGSLTIGIFKNKLSEKSVTFLAIFSVFISTVFSVWLLIQTFFYDYYKNENLFVWASINDYKFYFGFLVDKLSSLMFFVVTFVSLMVHIYTIGYMHGDKGFKRFFSYLNAFTFAMLILVGSNNLLLLFFGWEAVGLISYLLIGFWFKKQSAVFANLKAFLINRVGDFGFIIGIGLVFYLFENFDYFYIFNNLELLENKNITGPYGVNFSLTTAICICLFIGAMGKSAQFPLHSWLPDSMEGPTPISALIHAATMVTAGIYMVSRLSPIFELSTFALSFILITGTITALFMGFLGLVQNDIKKIIAYSTLSQLGYMTAALGCSAYSIAIFHLVTHAFFKALLFLCAGSVIIAMHHEQDIRKMGGLRKYMPITAITCLLGTVSLIGLPFTSGFFSKESIIHVLHSSTIFGADVSYLFLNIGLFVTVMYSMRLYLYVFEGDFKNSNSHIKPKESPFVITLPLLILTVPSILIGMFLFELFVTSDFFHESLVLLNSDIIATFSNYWFEYAIHSFVTIQFWIILLSIIFAFILFGKNKILLNHIKTTFSPLLNLFEKNYFFDNFFISFLAIKSTNKFGKLLNENIDISFIDNFFVNGTAKLISKVSNIVRQIQSGYIYQYALFMLVGLFAFIFLRVL